MAITFDEKLEAAWGLHKIEKAVLEKEIAELKAENEKLRNVLKPFADFYYNSRPCTDNAVVCEADDGDEFNILHGHFRKAYQVLESVG